MVVAIFSALQPEIDLIVDSLEKPASMSIARWPVWSGQIGKVEVVLARAGLGKVNTAALAAILWERHRPSLMLFTGVAGGLDPDLGIDDIVIGERTIQHDAGVIAPGGALERWAYPFLQPDGPVRLRAITRTPGGNARGGAFRRAQPGPG